MRFYKFFAEELNNVRMMTYSSEYTENAKSIQKDTGYISSEDHSQMSEIDFSKYYDSKASLFEWYFGYLENERKMDAVGKTVETIKREGFRRVCSFGAGPGVLEYLIKQMLGNRISIVATDYDTFYVNKGNELLGSGIVFEKFDFYNDDVCMLLSKYRPDLALLFGSACSMDNKTYETFLSKLKEMGVCNILTFEAGIDTTWQMFTKTVKVLRKSLIRYLLKKTHVPITGVHAYSRTKKDLLRIFKKSGFRAEPIPVYEYDCAFYLRKIY